MLVPRELGGGKHAVGEVAGAVAALARHCCVDRHGVRHAPAPGGLPGAPRSFRAACVTTSGRSSPHQLLLASATTEIGVGGDIRSSVCAVERDDGRFRLEKKAPVISYGESADGVLATARRSPDSPPNDQVLVLCTAPGLSLESRPASGTRSAFGAPAARVSSSPPRATSGACSTIPFADISSQDHAAGIPHPVELGVARDWRRRPSTRPGASCGPRPARRPASTSPARCPSGRADDHVTSRWSSRCSRAGAGRTTTCTTNPRRSSAMGFAISMNNFKVSSLDDLVVDIVGPGHDHLRDRRLPPGLALQPGSPAPRRARRRGDGQQRPHHRQQRPDAPGPPRTDDVAYADPYAPFRAELLGAGLSSTKGSTGLYGRSARRTRKWPARSSGSPPSSASTTTPPPITSRPLPRTSARPDRLSEVVPRPHGLGAHLPRR